MKCRSQVFKNVLTTIIVLLICTHAVTAQDAEHDDDSVNNLALDHEEDTCGNPNFLTLKGRLMEHYDISDEFYRLSPMPQFNNVARFVRTHASFYTHNSTQECSSLRVRANHHGGDTCPGRYHINRDVNRVPCVMREIQCLCDRCLIPLSLRQRQPGYKCQPIVHYFPVMRRTILLEDQADTWSYVLEPLAVGCRCSPRTMAPPRR